MVVPPIGTVVLIPFPFSDLSHTKLRPALVLVKVGREDCILAQITSKNYSGFSAIRLKPEHFSSGGLRINSFVRPGKLFTADHRLIRSTVGQIENHKFQEIIEAIVTLFRENREK